MPQLTFNKLPAASDLAAALLEKAELEFGPRSTDLTFAGVTEWPGGPVTLYPNENVSMIGISPRSVSDECQLIFQLSHEVVHQLSPNRQQSDAMMIEEGAAVWFSIYGVQYPESDYRDRALTYIQTDAQTENYRRALYLTAELDALHPNAIRALREVEPRFYAITPELIIDTLGAPKELAEALCERVPMRER